MWLSRAWGSLLTSVILYLNAAGIPESLIPVSMFITRYLAVFHGGGNTLVTKVFLEQPQTVTGTVTLYGMYDVLDILKNIISDSKIITHKAIITSTA